MSHSNNGLHKCVYASCVVCSTTSKLVTANDAAQAISNVRKLGWRPETRPVKAAWGTTYNQTDWYCPDHEQLRPSLKKNQVTLVPKDATRA